MLEFIYIATCNIIKVIDFYFLHHRILKLYFNEIKIGHEDLMFYIFLHQNRFFYFD